jgi:hypothetical protein
MCPALLAIGSSHSKDSQIVQAAKSEITCSARQDQAVFYSHLPVFFSSIRWKGDALKRNVCRCPRKSNVVTETMQVH